MQSQAPLAPYVGLWTRLQDFAPDELSALTEERQVVRLHLMRNTVHLVSVRDCLDWRTLFYPLHAAEFSAHFRPGTEGVDRDALLTGNAAAGGVAANPQRARQLLAELLAGRRSERAGLRGDASHRAVPGATTGHLGQERSRGMGTGGELAGRAAALSAGGFAGTALSRRIRSGECRRHLVAHQAIFALSTISRSR
jgi:hypothetical protein